MLYIIYKTTNLLNGKYYIGKHQTNDLFDAYLGSGKALKAAIKKYGRSNFKKEVLYCFDSEEEMNAKEKEIVNQDFVNDSQTYNLVLGGEGGSTFKGRCHTEETKQKLRNKHKVSSYDKIKSVSKSRQTRLSKYGCWTSDQTKKNISQAMVKYYTARNQIPKRVKRTREEINMSRSNKLKGHRVSDETRKKLSLKSKGLIPKNKNKTAMNNGVINKYIDKDDVQSYLISGWILGRLQYKKK